LNIVPSTIKQLETEQKSNSKNEKVKRITSISDIKKELKRKITQTATWMNEEKKKQEGTFFNKIVRHKFFDAFIILVIIMNTITMAMER
jgi:Fe2+ transport system protein B